MSSTAVGGYNRNFLNPSSALENPATLANMHALGVALYAERRFMLEELGSFHGVICIPVNYGGFAISGQRLGYTEFNQSAVGVSYGKNLGKFDLGVKFNYQLVRIVNYGTDRIISFDIAIITHLTDKVYTGLQVFNPTRSRFGTDRRERSPSRYVACFGYQISDKLLLNGGMIKEEDRSVQVQTALQYVLAKKLFARFGMNTENTTINFAFGWQLKELRIDISGSYDLHLGITPGVLILFEGKKKER